MGAEVDCRARARTGRGLPVEREKHDARTSLQGATRDLARGRFGFVMEGQGTGCGNPLTTSCLHCLSGASLYLCAYSRGSGGQLARVRNGLFRSVSLDKS